MKMTIGNREFEGTATEIAELLGLLEGGSKSTETRSQRAVSMSNGNSPFVSEEVAYNVLNRIPLADAQISLLKKLDEAEDQWTSAVELQKELNLSTREFAGLLGAFGRRISHTPGSSSRAFFDQYWDHDNGFNLYRLPPSVRSALRKANLV